MCATHNQEIMACIRHAPVHSLTTQSDLRYNSATRPFKHTLTHRWQWQHMGKGGLLLIKKKKVGNIHAFRLRRAEWRDQPRNLLIDGIPPYHLKKSHSKQLSKEEKQLQQTLQTHQMATQFLKMANIGCLEWTVGTETFKLAQRAPRKQPNMAWLSQKGDNRRKLQAEIDASSLLNIAQLLNSDRRIRATLAVIARA